MHSDNFFDSVQKELDRGVSFIPLIGSGVSYQSGIMLGSEIGNYLCYVYDKIFLDTSDGGWDLINAGWPSVPTEGELNSSRERIIEAYSNLCERGGVNLVSYGDVLDFQDYNSGSALSIDTLSSYLGVFLKRPLCPLIVPWKNRLKIYEYDVKSQEIVRALGKNVELAFYDICQDYPCNESELVKEIGLRSLYDWKSALNFLSRINKPMHNKRYAFYKEPNQGVIDSFNRFMVGNRRPNQNHHLIVRLTDVMRYRRIITTNFDTLLEDAFREDKKLIKVMSFEKDGELPSVDLMDVQMTIVKFHGDTHGTRADYTIDSTPSVKDKETFLNYFLSGRSGKYFIPSNILVVGHSLSEMRLVKLITHILENVPSFKVFSISTFPGDGGRTKSLFPKKFVDEGRIICSYPQKSEYCLYELYQRLTLSLMPGGFYFRYDQFVPPFSLSSSDETRGSAISKGSERSDFNKLIQYLADLCVNHVHREPDNHYYKMFLKYGGGVAENIITMEGGHGISRFMTSLYYELVENRGVKCLWVELEDHSSVDNILSIVLRSIFQEMGKLQQNHISLDFYSGHINEAKILKEGINDLAEKFEVKIKGYLSLIDITPSNWVIFIYGRNPFGECAEFGKSTWLGDDKKAYAYFHALVKALSNLNFIVVYIPLTKPRIECIRDNNKNLEKEMKKLHPLVDSSLGVEWYQLDKTYNKNLLKSKKKKEKIENFGEKSEIYNSTNSLSVYLEKLIKPLAKKENHLQIRESKEWSELRFLYVCTLFRQSRHLNSLISEATYPCPNKFNVEGIDNDKERSKMVFDIRNTLMDIGVFHKKPGGYVWKFRDVRLGISQSLERIKFEHLDRLVFKSIKSRSHYWIADWYFKAFLSTHHSTPLIESFYHYISALKNAKYSVVSKSTESKSVKKSDSVDSIVSIQYRKRIIFRCVSQLGKLARISGQLLKSWQHSRSETEFCDYEKVFSALGVELSGHEFKEVNNDWLKGVLSEDYKKYAKANKDDDLSKDVEYVNSLLYELFLELKNNKLLLRKDRGENCVFEQFSEQGLSSKESVCCSKKSEANTPINLCCIENAYELLDMLSCNEECCNDIVISLINFLKGNNDELRENYKSARKKLLDSCVKQPASLISFSEYYSEVAYMLVRWVKMVDRANLRCIENNEDFNSQTRKEWVAVTVLCALSLDLLQWVPVHFLEKEMILRSKCLAIYGMALAKLQRGYEAHRRLNEARSLDFYFNESAQGVVSAAVLLRRAEVYLARAEMLRKRCVDDRSERSGLPEEREVSVIRRYVVSIDDAYIALMNAEHLMKGKNQSSFWWGHLYKLYLRVYGVYDFTLLSPGSNYLPLLFKERKSHRDSIYRYFVRGLIASKDDSYRKLCFLDLFLLAWSRFNKCEDENIIFEKDNDSSSHLISKYAKFSEYDSINDFIGNEIGEKYAELYSGEEGGFSMHVHTFAKTVFSDLEDMVYGRPETKGKTKKLTN